MSTYFIIYAPLKCESDLCKKVQYLFNIITTSRIIYTKNTDCLTNIKNPLGISAINPTLWSRIRNSIVLKREKEKKEEKEKET